MQKGQLLFAVATPETAANGEDVNAARLARSEEGSLRATIGETGAEIVIVQQEIRIQKERVAVTQSLPGDTDWLLSRGDISLVQAKEREAQLPSVRHANA